MISQPLPEDEALSLGQSLPGGPLCVIPNRTLIQAGRFVCIWDGADGFLNLYTPRVDLC